MACNGEAIERVMICICPCLFDMANKMIIGVLLCVAVASDTWIDSSVDSVRFSAADSIFLLLVQWCAVFKLVSRVY